MEAPSNDHSTKQSESKTDLLSLLLPAELNTPSSTPSSKVSPSAHTQVLSSTGSLAGIFSKLNMRSPSMPNLFSSSSPDRPPPDLHNKLQAEPPCRSKTDTINSVVRTFSASKTLNQVLGLRNPEPFAPPSVIPSNLVERFEAGLQGYEQLHPAGVFTSRRSEGFTTSTSSQQGKTTLADILEEKESPVRASLARENTIAATSKLTIRMPKYTSRKQAVAAAQSCTFVDSDVDSAYDITSQHMDYESDEDYSSWKHGSSTTLAASDYSPPGSAAYGSSLSPPSFPPRTSSLSQLPELHSNDATASSLPHLDIKKLPQCRLVSTRHIASESNQHSTRNISSYFCNKQSSLKRSESLPVLFPSPDVAPAVKGFIHNEIARRYASKYVEANGALDDDTLQPSHEASSSPPPQITIQAPSSVKSTWSSKRAFSSTRQGIFGPPLAQRSHRDGTTGLPVLPLEADADSKADFAGNTDALLTVLLTWSHTMWALYRRLHDPKLFSIHPAFAYLITPPVRKELLSVSFYDTSVEPHKEVRFIGPGDVAEISYHEVDVFEGSNSKTNYPASPRCSSPVGVIKQTFRLTDKEASKHVRYMSMAQRAKTGEGRWCYVLVKGNTLPDGRTPPHLILAWHISAVTSTSDCLHTLYTDDTQPSKAPAPSQNRVKRFSSLQNLAQALRSPAKFDFHHSLRTASSSSYLPLVDPYLTPEQREGVTLHRTIIKLEKAGFVPLLEGFRADVAAFRDWMEACGKGKGKVILWRERD